MTYSILAFLLHVAVPVAAQCDEALTTVEMVDCFSRELRAEEERLASAADRLSADASPRERVLRQRAQMAWMLFRDLECEAAAEEFQGGTMAPVASLQCRLQLTTERLTTLEATLATVR